MRRALNTLAGIAGIALGSGFVAALNDFEREATAHTRAVVPTTHAEYHRRDIIAGVVVESTHLEAGHVVRGTKLADGSWLLVSDAGVRVAGWCEFNNLCCWHFPCGGCCCVACDLPQCDCWGNPDI